MSNDSETSSDFDSVADAPSVQLLDDGRLVLTKGVQRYIFECEAGREAELLDRLRQQVADPSNDLTWFDAAVVSHEMGRRLSDRLTNKSSIEPLRRCA
jgi:hypothetical protein